MKYLYNLVIPLYESVNMELERDEKGLDEDALITSITSKEIRDAFNQIYQDDIRYALKYDRGDCQIIEVEGVGNE